MRSQFVLVMVLVVAVVFGATWHFKQAPANSPSSVGSATNHIPTTKPALTVITSTPPRVVGNPITPEERAAAIETEIDHLRELAMKDDAGSLTKILADLTHSEKEIRDVAIESVKEFGSSNAIPALKAAAQLSEDTSEKIALLEAAEFLALPRLTFDSTPDSRTPEEIRVSDERAAEKIAQQEAQRVQTKRTHSVPSESSSGSWSATNNIPRK
ncbi:MAG: hypothetical protein JWM68_3203 [Verrucomicrobiales bacterium]|nr:hypothetical protein [Verrucomicrobiales bacterium]